MSNYPRYEADPNQVHTWVVTEDMVICLTRSGAVKDEIWNKFCEDVSLPQIKRVMGVSYEGVSFNSVQRKGLSAVIEGKMLCAVLDSTMTRGILTALSWFGLSVKSFSWKNLDEAIRYIALGGDGDIGTVTEIIDELLERSGARSLNSLVA
ncbi:hypothetical protein G6O69_23095 [Pseudenhygromyxa sp. WMMC2535]|uniref:hypothetical protein n=1 Tax=Pseudenhygromyxa sp. WMMC2535 TaxID=2712867 RepID=UPI0015575462|nr:hypothetical protein [Pseudenhygromyxa sp. WMMC2535]NVB40745.1 hypothetical protein [Pseudenhygromyxa sp. WMMC2535]